MSRSTLRNIRQNLFLAFVYSVLGVPIAAGVLYPFFGVLLSPMLAAAAMKSQLAVGDRERASAPAMMRLLLSGALTNDGVLPKEVPTLAEAFQARGLLTGAVVGRLLDGLREAGLYDAATIAITSDHGESLGEHGWYFTHANLVYDEQVRIPLLLKLPGAREEAVG